MLLPMTPATARTLRVALALLLFAGGGALARWAEVRADVPRPPPGPAAVLGGFAPLAAQASLIRADVALRERREADALLLFDVASELDPGSVPLAAEVAHQLAYGLGTPDRGADARWAFHSQALETLSAAVEHAPTSARARYERGRLLFERIAHDTTLSARFTESTGHSPVAAAADDFRDAAELDPEDLLSAQLHAMAAVLHAVDLYAADEPHATEWADRGADAFAKLEAVVDAALASGELEDEWPGRPQAAAARAFAELVRVPAEQRAEAESRFLSAHGHVLPLPDTSPPPPR